MVLQAFREFDRSKRNKRQIQVNIVSAKWWTSWAAYVEDYDNYNKEETA
jgi:hypothetical protein